MSSERKARTKFKIGQRVRLTPEAVEHGIRFRSGSDAGVIRGFCRDDDLVRVVPDGCRTATSFHVTFWRPDHGTSLDSQAGTVADTPSPRPVLAEAAELLEMAKGGAARYCDQGIIDLAEFDATCERVDATATRLRQVEQARPLDDWHEDHGPVLWWCFPISEPPFAGTPLDSDWPGYHTHWTPIIVPSALLTDATEGADNA